MCTRQNTLTWLYLCLVLLLQMQVWDTAGQERFRTITQSYYRSAHGAMVAYDITRRPTFESVSHWIREVEQFGAAGVVLILIGTKNEDTFLSTYFCFISKLTMSPWDTTDIALPSLSDKY